MIFQLSERGALRDVHLDADGLHARLQHLRHLRRPQPPGKDLLPRSNSQVLKAHLTGKMWLYKLDTQCLIGDHP